MPNLNKVMLIGNLTRDPELRYTPKGTAVADLGLAINSKSKDAQGNLQEETTFVDVTVWGVTAENAGKYLTKGRPVFVEGKLRLDQWTDKDTGQNRQRLKVVGHAVQFLGSGGGEGGSQSRQGSGPAPQSPQPATSQPTMDYLEEDDIPF